MQQDKKMWQVKSFPTRFTLLAANFLVMFWWLTNHYIVAGGKTCAENRKIFTSSSGVVSDGIGSYPLNKDCEWLIRAPYKNQTITVKFTEFFTECSFDFLYIFDGASYKSPLLGAFTGKGLPADITSSSYEMLIMLSSDYFTIRKGFSFSYEASDCPRKCSAAGTCSSGKCICDVNYNGDYCQYLSCPKLCYESISKGKCDISEKKCKCYSGYFGDSCSLSSVPNSDPNSWHTLSAHSPVLKPRSSHVAAYHKETDTVWVHGGRSLNGIFDDILMYNVTSNSWHDFPGLTVKPAARSHHAGGFYSHYFVIYGGELAQGTAADDLWMFNTVTKTWNQPPGHGINKPNAVAGHTANIIDSKLYIFGGRTSYSGFSTDVFLFDLKSSSGWRKLTTSGGKTSMLRLFGHSSVYNSYTNSLLVFGGELAVTSRKDAVKQNRLLSFSLEHHIWTELIPNQHAMNMLPTGRSFHSAVIAGDYMVIYGGLLTTNIIATVCNSNELLYYNIKCNAWVKTSTITSKSPASSLSEPPSEGRHSHVGIMRDYQTMLVVGGYNGSMHEDIMAYKMPKSVVFKNSSGLIEPGQHCGLYDEKNACFDDLACGWCFDNSKCLSLQDSYKCTSNFDSRHCTSHCTAYTSCTSCIMFGNASNHHCSWCVQDKKCYPSQSPGGRCAADVAGLQIGWWGSTSKLLTSVEKCMTDNIPPGLTITEFKEPVNRDFPDSVWVANSPHLDNTNIDHFKKIYELKALVYPYVLETAPSQSKRREVYLSGRRAWIRLSMSNDALVTSKRQVAYITYDNIVKTVNAKSEDNGNLFPVLSKNARYYMECQVNVSQRSIYQAQISWNLTSSSAAALQAINASFLHPYIGGICSNLVTCMACMTDAGCGWCTVTSSCISRSTWSTCVTAESQISYLVLNATMCVKCTDYHDCKTCAQNSYCSWKPVESICSRNGMSSVEIKSPLNCSSACSSRSNCSSCLADNECRWCEGKQICFSASDYMMRYSMGDCYTYKIRDNTLKDTTCRNCSRHSTCAACLADHQCGWCGNVDNPLIGICRDGDFSGPQHNGNCSSIMNTNETVAWSYEKCPDVDECRLKLYNCDSNSTCFNTYGSYNCICNQGYTGDGKTKCEKTCYPPCQHGQCGADYQCKCYLGWKGINCSIDCGCNGHSTCNTGIGICDSCQGNTEGKYCQKCVFGAFGNATTAAGCQLCQCNKHGDESKGICDRQTGKCFCKNHTTGDGCEKCENGLIGDPSNGGTCFHDCTDFSLIKTVSSGTLSFKTTPYNCLWVISSLNASNHDVMFGRQKPVNTSSMTTLDFTQLRLPCQDSHVYVYDSAPQGAVSTLSKFTLLASVCGYDSNLIRTIVSMSGIMTVLFKGPKSKSNIAVGSFVAKFNVYDCPYRCPGNRFCQDNGIHGFKCVCKDDWTGANCDEIRCPSNCSNETGQGFCDPKTSRCICLPGFIGKDCNQTLSERKFGIHKLSVASVEQPNPRYGQTFLHYGTNSTLVLYGGRGLRDSNLFNDVWSFNLESHSYAKIPTQFNHNGRYFHCGVIYKRIMFIYGGVTKMGVSNDLLKLDLQSYQWTVAKPSSIPQTLFGHSCTLVDNFMFVIGGYSRVDGLNEFTFKINLDNYGLEYLKTTGFPLSGVYGHSAVYDQAGSIFVFGGIAFFKEKTQESNRVYSLNVVSMTWNYLKPIAKNQPFQLFLHSAAMLDDIMYVTGGYSDINSRGFNTNLFIWKKKCDSWMKISLKDRQQTEGDTLSSVGAGSSLIAFNRSLLIYTGYNGQLSGDLWNIKLPKDLCSIFGDKNNCLSQFGCSWCQSKTLKNNGTCYSLDAKTPFPCNVTGGVNVTANHSWVIHPGTPCNKVAIAQKPCSTYGSCVSCLATFPGLDKPNCHWCFGEGCRSHSQACTAKFDLKSISSCLELGCEASSCENCGGAGKCFWTRHYYYQSESQRGFDRWRQYDWNCFRTSLESRTQYNVTDKAPPNPCPKKCHLFKSCESCIASEGAEGGSKECFWSQKLKACLPRSRKHVTCISGDCATIYDRKSGCPSACSGANVCKQCLKSIECSWCAKNTPMGQGVCTMGGLEAPNTGDCSSTGSSNSSSASIWAPVLCPNENECLNGRHDCKTAEDCIDLEYGFTCKCQAGYVRDFNSTKCKPVCKSGCIHGECVKPDVCQCMFGWTGNNCSVPCKCNQNSNCPNATHPDVCLKCHNYSQGPSCNECLPGFVGDPTANISCTPCSLPCNSRSSICISSSEAAVIPDYIKKNSTLLHNILKRGPKSIKDAVCIDCQGNSEGQKCEKCIQGYFERHGACQLCLCNGHSQSCHNTTGEGCKCQQNTETGDCIKSSDCWRKQCTKCKKNFIGNPTDGRQCFKRMSRSSSIAIGNEKHRVGGESTIEPIPANKTFFFTVPPKYTNVDIRLTVDVFQGGLDLFITTENMLFTVDVNYTNGEQLLRFMKKPSRRKREIVVDRLDIDDFPIITVYNDEPSRMRRSSPSDKPVLPDTNITASLSSLSMFTEYRNDLFMISSIQRRVVIGISYKKQNFGKERFYIGVVTRGNRFSPLTAGLLYFRQDLPQIDLFVFFSVFFSVFFLILSLFFLVWKITQLHNGRQAVIAHQIALDTMASRPFACYSIHCDLSESTEEYKTAHSNLVGLFDGNTARKKDCRTITPMAVENTEDEMAAIVTVFVQFPENEESPRNVAVCSALVQATPQQLVAEVCCTGQGGAKSTTRYMSTVNL